MSGTALAKVSQGAYRAALRFSRGNEADAEDAAQESVLRFLIKKPEFRDEAKLRGWFSLVGANVSISKLRHQKVCDRKDRTYTLDSDRFGPTDQPALRNELADIVDAAIEKLVPRDQELVRRRYFDGETYSEIAAGMSIPLGTVMSGLSRTGKRLRRLLARFLSDEV